MRLRRKPLYYVVNLIIPCCLLSVVAVGTFLLQPNCYDRLGLSTSMFTVSECGFYVIKTVNAAVAVYTSKYKFSELKKCVIGMVSKVQETRNGWLYKCDVVA